MSLPEILGYNKRGCDYRMIQYGYKIGRFVAGRRLWVTCNSPILQFQVLWHL